MICGMGTDVVEISRIGTAYQRYGLKFASRILGPSELSLFKGFKESRQVEYLAGRFAAKEAIAKAIGCGIGRLNMPSVEIVLVETGLEVRFSGKISAMDRSRGPGATNPNQTAGGPHSDDTNQAAGGPHSDDGQNGPSDCDVSALPQDSSSQLHSVQRCPQGIWHLSISHTRDIAFAVAVCEG